MLKDEIGDAEGVKVQILESQHYRAKEHVTTNCKDQDTGAQWVSPVGESTVGWESEGPDSDTAVPPTG